MYHVQKPLSIFFSPQKIGVTNYPIGVGINAVGEVIIADNHNNFNLSVFSQDGQILAALKFKVHVSLWIPGRPKVDHLVKTQTS